MIEFDYKINRDIGDETVAFKPDKIPRMLDNLVYIEGPNSIGKSTLLHILACSLHGLKNKRIYPALRYKMENLVLSKHQKLSFRVTITDNTGDIKIISEKKDPDKKDIIVHEVTRDSKKILTPELFDRKYNLIYDIPDDPTNRLNQLTEEIEDSQVRYGNKVGELEAYVRRLIEKIKDSRDPERISELRKNLNKTVEEQELLNDEINSFENELNMLEYATYTHYSNKYDSRCKKIKEQIDAFDKQMKKTKGKQKRDTSKHKRLFQAFQTNLTSLQILFDKTSELLKRLLPKEESHKLKIWERINLAQTFKALEFDENLEELVEDFRLSLKDEYQKTKSQKTVQEAQMYRKLVKVLEDYTTLDVELPGLKQSISEYIIHLENLLNQKEHAIKHVDNIKETLDLLEQLNKKKNIIEDNVLSNLRKLSDQKIGDTEFDSTYELISEELSSFRTQLKENKEKLKNYEGKLSLLDKDTFKTKPELGEGDLEKYSIYTEKQLLGEVSGLKTRIKEKKVRRTKNEYHIERFSKEIEALEKKKPHKYQDYLADLNSLFIVIQKLKQSLLNTFHGYINDIQDRKKVSISDNKEQADYNEAVFIYLGKRLSSIRHIEEEYEVEKIDLIERIIKTKEGKDIRLDDMGTGQSQAAYLTAKLDTADDRKIIALFDEVAMMDSRSLNSIFKKFRKLNKENRLLLGIVVQKGDEVKIQNLIA